jgi:hypothetical protein
MSIFLSAPRAAFVAAAAIVLAGGAFAQEMEAARPGKLPAHRAMTPPPISNLPAPKPLTGAPKAYGGAPIDVTTYHYDNSRTGWNPTETDLTPASVKSTSFGLLTTLQVDGNVLGQPLLVSNFVMADRKAHDVLIIATGHNSVYAFDAQTYATLWHVNLGPSQSSTDVGCGDITPEYGIDSTPVIVRSSATAGRIYLVAATEPSTNVFQAQLHALNLKTGADVVPAVTINPTATLSNSATLAFDPKNQYVRAGLAYNKGAIYVGVSSHCDDNDYSISGWLLRYNSALTLLDKFHTIETPTGLELASVWMSGFAPAIDAAGNVYVATGNGAYASAAHANDWGESVLKLPPSLSVVRDWFTPSIFSSLNSKDLDLGSGGVVLLPTVEGQTAPPMAVAIGKTPTLYLLNQDALGREKTNDTGALQAQTVGTTAYGVWGGAAYFDSPTGPVIFLQASNDYLHLFSVATGSTPSLTVAGAGSSKAGFGGSSPIVSSNGSASNSGVVWLIRRSSPLALEAYDAGALGAPIYQANIGAWSDGSSHAMLTPMQANGRVYAPGYKSVYVFGLTQ